ncbi:ATP-binding protein [Rhodocyclus tenuis]|uniref:ATP-binding protein n=1 Tax=Rhodocyclus tenuis TaxID=1066 RepID=UPI00190834DF|nr:ATP-binding protein [Rhodocyclus tenuis]MBK1679193.1 hypothetical protein [Rhodocyclus tenuis]
MRFFPRTLLARTFLLISLLLCFAVASWLALFALAEREPRARQVAQLTVSVVNLTRAALVAAEPARRRELLRELDAREGVRVFPAEPSDQIVPPPDGRFHLRIRELALAQLATDTRFASAVNGQSGLWVSFHLEPDGDVETIGGAHTDDPGEDEFWLMLPGSRAEHQFPWPWLAWAGLILALALLVAWLIVSRVSQPLRALAAAAAELGRGQRPEPLPERGSLELQQLAEAFNRMSEDLRRIDSERAETLAGISHDLRTPLARLRLEAEMSIVDADARAAVAADIEQMNAVIAQFLDFARGESGAPTAETDIDAIAGESVARSLRSGTAIRFSPGTLPPTHACPQALARAIDNLLDNARKYAENGIELVTRVDANGDRLIEVLDRGPGIPAEETERLKRPFTRLQNARSDAGGAGLGLAIVERIARLHGGSLELLPRPGGGLIARLRLPADGIE